MPTFHTRSPAKKRKLQKSMRQLTTFLTNQKTWLRRSENALRSKHFLESMSLSLNQIHIILRKALWIQAQMQLFHAKRKIMSDKLFFAMLTHSTGILPKNVPDKDLYAAAYKFDVIDEKTSKELALLNSAATDTLRVALERKPDMRKLKNIANKIFDLNTICIQVLELDIEELKEDILNK